MCFLRLILQKNRPDKYWESNSCTTTPTLEQFPDTPKVHCSIAPYTKKMSWTKNLHFSPKYFVPVLNISRERWAWRSDWKDWVTVVGGGAWDSGDFPEWEPLPNLSTFSLFSSFSLSSLLAVSPRTRIGVRFFWIAYTVKYVEIVPSCLWHLTASNGIWNHKAHLRTRLIFSKQALFIQQNITQETESSCQ